jgi:UDP-N-acetylmuramoyl-tripeptide--D-alanyl-D-alanine ligase
MKEFLKRTVAALLRVEASAVLRKYEPRIVAITGSVGKTSTKDAIYQVVAHAAYTRKSEKSFNSELGIPLTILGVPNAWNNPLRWAMNFLDGLAIILFSTHYPQWLVLEVGADRPGDIQNIAKWVPVDIAVITRLPEMPVHVEFFDSPQAVIEEKASLIGALKPQGTLILFYDDERSRAFAARTNNQTITFGFDSGADVRGHEAKILFEEGGSRWPIGMEVQVRVGEVSAPISVVGAIGAHALLPLLAAAAVGKALGHDIADIVEALKSYTPPPGRMRLVRGIKKTLIIDDSYNSSPAAVAAALDTLALIKSEAGQGRRIAVLGDMLELGRHSTAQHRRVGEQAAKQADILVTVGFRARDIAEGALNAGMVDSAIFQYEDAGRAGEELKNLIQEGDCILVKGSQSIRTERVVEELMAEPERASELLVRQDPEWKKR